MEFIGGAFVERIAKPATKPVCLFKKKPRRVAPHRGIAQETCEVQLCIFIYTPISPFGTRSTIVFSMKIRLKIRYPRKKVSNCIKPIEIDIEVPINWLNLTLYENHSFHSLVLQTA
jgi:hypothetical protein